MMFFIYIYIYETFDKNLIFYFIYKIIIKYLFIFWNKIIIISMNKDAFNYNFFRTCGSF